MPLIIENGHCHSTLLKYMNQVPTNGHWYASHDDDVRGITGTSIVKFNKSFLIFSPSFYLKSLWIVLGASEKTEGLLKLSWLVQPCN